VPDRHAAGIDLFVYIRSLGHWEQPERRVVAEVHELEGVDGGRPHARLLHRWDQANDRFEDVDLPERINSSGMWPARLAEFESLARADAGKPS
jgi:hypothetical protein